MLAMRSPDHAAAAGRRRAPPPRRQNRRAATARPGADSRAAPCGSVRPRRWRCGCRARTALRSRRRGSSTGPSPPDATSRCVPSSSNAVRPSRLRSSTASRTARRARRASPCSRCRCRSRPAIGVRFTGAPLGQRPPPRLVHGFSKDGRTVALSRKQPRVPARPARPGARNRTPGGHAGGSGLLRDSLNRAARFRLSWTGHGDC